jgi:hypothetical protein
MDMLMFGYALCFGYDPSEFWPVQYGALGRGAETEIQHEKATGKGRLDFVLTFQEQLQEFLPASLSFIFDQRDEQGDLVHAQVSKAWADFAKVLTDGRIVNSNEARVLLADNGVIPRSWTEDQFDESTDQETTENEPDEVPDDDETEVVGQTPTKEYPVKEWKTLRATLLDLPEIRLAGKKFPTEEIVLYSWPENTVTTLFARGEEITRKRVWK